MPISHVFALLRLPSIASSNLHFGGVATNCRIGEKISWGYFHLILDGKIYKIICKKRGNNFVVRITDSERKVVQKENKRNRLVKAGGRKRGKAATYYLLNDDWESLRIVADLRGYKDKTYYNRRFNETKVFTAIQRLLQDV